MRHQPVLALPVHGTEVRGDEVAGYATVSTQGFTWTLAGLKALLEHGIELNLVRDRFPNGPKHSYPDE